MPAKKPATKTAKKKKRGLPRNQKTKNAEQRDALHPIHVSQYWQGRKGYKSTWQRAHEAGQGQLFKVKNASAATVQKLYEKAIKADDAWQAELIKIFKSAAGNARYDKRGESTPKLKRLKAAKLKADAARRGVVLNPKRQKNKTIITRPKKVVVINKTRNGSGSTKAKAIHETFTGKPSRKTTEMHTPTGTPRELAQLGILKSIKTRGKRYTAPAGVRAILCADTKGKLHVASTRPLKLPLKNPTGDNLGEVLEVEYIAAKPHLGHPSQTLFFHELGEEGGRKPELITDANGELHFHGGDYQITREGILN